MIWSRRQASYQIVQATCLSNPHRKIDENGENITLVIWSRRQASDQIVQATPPEYPHPKTNDNWWNFNLSQFWAIYRLPNSFWGYVGWFGMFHWYQKMNKTKIWYNTSQNIKPKWAQNWWKWWKMPKMKPQFESIFGHFKATKQLLGYVRWPGMSHWYQLMTKTLFWYSKSTSELQFKMSQKLMKIVKNAENKTSIWVNFLPF